MTLTQVKVKLAPEGNLNIPSIITRKAGFSPDEEAIIVLTDDGLFVCREKKSPTVDDVLQALIACGEIQLSDLGEHLQVNLVPGITLERIHEALSGVSVPIEEMIHEEREKYTA
jgi:hypothetical protein